MTTSALALRQHMDALQIANGVRTQRAVLRIAVRDASPGDSSWALTRRTASCSALADVLEESPACIGTARLGVLLKWVHGSGPAWTRRFGGEVIRALQGSGLSPAQERALSASLLDTLIGGLTDRQRDAVVATLRCQVVSRPVGGSLKNGRGRRDLSRIVNEAAAAGLDVHLVIDGTPVVCLDDWRFLRVDLGMEGGSR